MCTSLLGLSQTLEKKGVCPSRTTEDAGEDNWGRVTWRLFSRAREHPETFHSGAHTPAAPESDGHVHSRAQSTPSLQQREKGAQVCQLDGESGAQCFRVLPYSEMIQASNEHSLTQPKNLGIYLEADVPQGTITVEIAFLRTDPLGYTW